MIQAYLQKINNIHENSKIEINFEHTKKNVYDGLVSMSDIFWKARDNDCN